MQQIILEVGGCFFIIRALAFSEIERLRKYKDLPKTYQYNKNHGCGQD